MKDENKTWRDTLPEVEANYIMPVWLVCAIIGAAIAETVIIGWGVWVLYGLWVGWFIGFVVASTQALGSQMYSYNATHNARRFIKWRTKAGQRYYNEWEAEPKFDTMLPLLISIGAGIVAAAVGVALYRSIDTQAESLSLTLIALSIASPLGSIAAALLNGLFMSNELALRRFQEGAEQGPEPATVAAISTAPQPEPEPELTPMERAIPILERDPDISGAALARQVGVSDGWGRKLKQQWKTQHRNGKQPIPEVERQ